MVLSLSTRVRGGLSVNVLFSSTCSEPQVLIFRRILLYTCSIWYCHSLWEFVVACRYKYYFSLHVSSLKCSSSGGYSCIHAAYGTVTLYESSWWPVGKKIYFSLHVSSLKCSSSGEYRCIHAAYGTVTLYESSWWPVSINIIFLYMFRASSARLQENKIVYMQHMVLSLSTRVRGGLSVKNLFSSTCFEPQVLIVRRIQLYTCSIWYCHSSCWPVGTQLSCIPTGHHELS